MPFPDLTVDTNVFLHSCNAVESRQAHSIDFLIRLLNCPATKLAIDVGFSTDPSINTSLIGGEYLAKLVPGTLPSSVLQQLALTGRIAITAKSVNPQNSNKLNQLVSNKRDRTFIKVCANSAGGVLVSHDFLDFSKKVRKNLEKIFNIQITDAETCAPQV
jgi:hypothetical protein